MKNELPESGSVSNLQLFSDNARSPLPERQTIDELGLSPRSKNCLKRADVNFISQLTSLSKDKIKAIKNLGWRSMREIIDRLQELPVADEIITRFKQAQTECFIENDQRSIEKLILNEEIINVLHSVGITTIGELLLYSEEELLLISNKQYEGVKSTIRSFVPNITGNLLNNKIGEVEIEEIKSALLEHGMYRNHLASIEDIKYRVLILEKETDFTIEGKRLVCPNQKKFLASVKLPVGITTIESNAFKNQPIKEIVIPEGVTEIKSFSFSNCAFLEKILFPESMRTIENDSFWPCPSIQKIIIPNSIQDCNDGSFNGCDFLQELVVPARLLPKFVKWRYSCLPDTCQIIVDDLEDKIYGDFIIESSKLLKYLGDDSQTVIVVPEGINEISDGAFARSPIKGIILPMSLTKIGKFAFAGCNNLESIAIPEGVQQIGFLAFDACFSLSEMSLPSNLLSEIDSYGLRLDTGYNDCRITINDAP